MITVDEAALAAAHKIEDIMCQHHDGGRAQRLARIQVAIVEAIEEVRHPIYVGMDFGATSDLTVEAAFVDGKLVFGREAQCPSSTESLPAVALAQDGEGAARPDRMGSLVDEESSAETGIAGQPASTPVTQAPPACDVGAALTCSGERPPQPLPQPAILATAQNEEVVIQGADQQAQKEEAGHTAASAGGASAHEKDADPRNSSRSTGEVTLDAPTVPVERTESPITMGEQVLRLWSTTYMSKEEIAEKVGCSRSSIEPFLTQARAKGDRRGYARRAENNSFGARVDPHREIEPPASGYSKPPVPRPLSPLEPPAPKPVTLRGTFDAMGVVAIDTKAHIIRGPLGDWQASAPVARTIKRMNSGGLFDRRTLLEAGPWPGEDSFSAQIPSITRHLAAIGVEFVDVKRAGCRIRRAGE
jgi:hypothetical protein